MRPAANSRLVALLAGAALALTACGYRGAASLPLPGGVGKGGYSVTMVFDDVTNLVPEETCRAGDVVVGSVESITLRRDLRAEVVCRVSADVRLPANAAPTLRETSLLGERFVALDPPAGQAPVGSLPPGASLGASGSHVVPDVEVVLGALSQVLNGGGLENVETISRELSAGLSGADLGATTRTVHRLVRTLNDHRGEIVRALEGLDRLAAELGAQRSVIASALDSVPAGIAVLEEERPQLVRTLVELGKLSDTASPFFRQTGADTVADFEHLARILNNLAESKERLATALESITTFPFPSYSKYVTRYDYAGMYGLYALDLDSFNTLLAQHAPTPSGPAAATPAAAEAQSGQLAIPGLEVSDVGITLPDLAVPNRVIENLLRNLAPTTAATNSGPPGSPPDSLRLGGAP
jgi:phospholipid/cholesterol/gamma-HCH transport system substrate-binding protein